MSLSKTQSAYERASKVLPFGVTSNFRFWGEGKTPIAARGEGAYLYDLDGNRYIDYRLAFGPVILGHAYEAVNRRVSEAIGDGTLFAMTHMWEIRAAERIQRMCPGVDRVRFANSGTEATMHAIRLARTYTGREKVLKFEGHYHGMHDYLLFSTAGIKVEAAGPPDAPVPAPQTPGIPRVISDLVLTAPWNDFEYLEKVVTRHGEELAAIIFEPIMGNAASIGPLPGWLEHIRALCDRYGIVMIMDEVKTGFRVAPGGAQELFGVQADLVTYAKALGNGFPIAALGGKQEIMDHIGPGRMLQGGTYTGNAVGTAAADAVLELLEDGEVLRSINARGERLSGGLSEILTRHGIAHHINGPGSMFGLVLTEGDPPRNIREWLQTDQALYTRIAMELIKRGAMPDPDGREPWFLCYALSDQDVDDTLTAFEEAVKAATG
ncbi:MAG TPA: aspartate aminotransferase family protein [Chloroflexi bacterium]|nr:aspartate aminotransferase family protein [Chloroflexota bacterium]